MCLAVFLLNIQAEIKETMMGKIGKVRIEGCFSKDERSRTILLLRFKFPPQEKYCPITDKFTYTGTSDYFDDIGINDPIPAYDVWMQVDAGFPDHPYIYKVRRIS